MQLTGPLRPYDATEGLRIDYLFFIPTDIYFILSCRHMQWWAEYFDCSATYDY
jgi:hypothetical protein